MQHQQAVSGYKAASHGIVPDFNVDYTIEELLAGTDKEMDIALWRVRIERRAELHVSPAV